MDDYKVFGNPLPESVVDKAKKATSRLAKRFGFDPDRKYELGLERMGYAWDEFGIEKFVEREGAGSHAPALLDPEKHVVIGTIRMGFGHYRMALAIASAARSMGLTPCWLDLLSFPDTAASKTIAHMEKLYNLGSRLSQRSKLFNGLWERITSDIPQRITYVPRDREMARLFSPIVKAVPPGLPYLSTHPWAGHAAVHAGVGRIVNVVPDNSPLAFHLVEGSVHAVQTPSSYTGYRSLRNMGVKGGEPLLAMPFEDIEYVGHYVDHELVLNIEEDCEARFARIRDKRPRRILLTMGGAGAQVQRFKGITAFLTDALAAGKVTLFINMGDHEGRWAELREYFEGRGIEYVLHSDWKETRRFALDAVERDPAGDCPIHVFLNRDTFAAVYSTNLLMRASDLMITKPSELSFYPVPKLFIQRVGRHEAWGAIRAAEIGDGTLETGSEASLFQALRLIVEEDDLLELYCSRILRNKTDGIYDGAYQAVHSALAMRPRTRE